MLEQALKCFTTSAATHTVCSTVVVLVAPVRYFGA
jgi:hypothetical protein